MGCHFLLQCVKVKSLSRVRLFATPWTAAYQAPPSMGFSRQEYWSGVPVLYPTDRLGGSKWNGNSLTLPEEAESQFEKEKEALTWFHKVRT